MEEIRSKTEAGFTVAPELKAGGVKQSRGCRWPGETGSSGLPQTVSPVRASSIRSDLIQV